MHNRRQLLGLLGLGALAGPQASLALQSTTSRAAATPPPLLKPPRLRAGDRVGLYNPASAAFETEETDIVIDSLRALDLEPILAPNFHSRRGYLAGSDEQRASDLNHLFADPAVKGIFAFGGWGSARLLNRIDYDLVASNPKVFVGFSDVTALLLALHARTGLVTFHGPVPRRQYNAEWLRQVAFEGERPVMSNPAEVKEGWLAQTDDRIKTIRPGRARGRLLGGNLTVLSAIVGSPYLPNWDGCLLFLEDVREAVYRVDRMLTQLKLAGILDQVAAFIFGNCSRCDSDNSYGSLTLEEVLRDHAEPLEVPSWQGAQIGHIPEQFTLPLGVEAEVDATAGTIQLLEPAVL